MPEGDDPVGVPRRPETNGPLDDDAPFYRKLVERAPHMILVFDALGTVTYVSPAVKTLAGVTPEEGMGTNIVDYVEPDELLHTAEALAYKVEHPDEPFRPLEIHFQGFDRQRTAEVVGRPGTDPGNENIAVLIRDRTRRARLQDIIDSVMRSEPIEHTLGAIAKLASEQLRLGGVAIAYAKTGDRLDDVVATGVPDELVEWTRRVEAGLPWAQSIAEGVVVVRSLMDLPAELRAVARDAGFGGCWSAPLRERDGVAVGAMTLWTPEDVPAAPAERELLSRLSRTAWFAIDTWTRDQAVAYAAAHDALTGAFNRSTFLDRVATAVPRGEAEPDDGVFMLSIDLDGFKAINDQHGHAAGDQVLVAVTERIRATVREGDIVARMGGDEFAVLCPGISSIDEATRVADRIITSVQQPVHLDGGGAVVAVGVSVGIAYDELASLGAMAEGPWVDGLFARADSALYAAKAAGKGCWRFPDTGARRPR